jgi:hypothetical protein
MMEENTRGVGKMESNMERENSIKIKRKDGEKDFGVKEKEQDG